MKAEIKKIVLDLGGKEVSLSVEQGKKLHKVLDEMFGEKKVQVETYPVYIERNRWWWEYPKPIWYSGTNMPDQQITYCSNDSSVKFSC